MASPRPSLTSTASVESSGDDVSDSGSFRSPLPQRWPRPPPPPPEPKSTTTVTVDSLHVDKHASMPGILNGTFNKTTVMTFLVPGGGPSHDLDPATLDHMVTDAVRINQETLESFVPSSKGADADAIAVKLPGTKEQVEGLSRRWCCLISALVVLSLVTLLGTGVLSLASWRTSRSPVKAATEATIELLSAEEKHFAALEGSPALVGRSEWLAQPPKWRSPNALPAQRVVVAHSSTDACLTAAQCVETVRTLQMVDVEQHRQPDIRDNFLVGGDGRVYWARGFAARANSSGEYDNGAIEVVFIGNFDEESPPEEMVSAFRKLVDTGVRDRKIAEDYALVARCQLVQGTPTGLALVQVATLPGGPPLITRPRWLAAAPAAPLDRNTLPVSLVIVCHTATTSCHSEPQCIDSTRSVQWFHQNSRHWADVGYNFLVGGDGSVYWGRGFDFMGSHTKGFNNGSIAVAFIGTYLDIVPSKEQVEAFDKLMTMGVRGGKIAEDYTLVAQCQLKVTAAPGLALVEEMKSWPHFNSSLPVRCTAG